MNMKLLTKIEDLTLYLIKQDKKNYGPGEILDSILRDKSKKNGNQ